MSNEVLTVSELEQMWENPKFAATLLVLLGGKVSSDSTSVLGPLPGKPYLAAEVARQGENYIMNLLAVTKAGGHRVGG